MVFELLGLVIALPVSYALAYWLKKTGHIKYQDELDKLFGTQSHFTKLGTQNEKGSGLGLLLCKELVEKQGGEIEVKSKKSEGSTFSFTLLKSQITSQSPENLAIIES